MAADMETTMSLKDLPYLWLHYLKALLSLSLMNNHSHINWEWVSLGKEFMDEDQEGPEEKFGAQWFAPAMLMFNHSKPL